MASNNYQLTHFSSYFVTCLFTKQELGQAKITGFEQREVLFERKKDGKKDIQKMMIFRKLRTDTGATTDSCILY